MQPITEISKHTDLNLNQILGEQLWKLYDTPRTINVETFYQIMETGNLMLLVESQKKLNEKQQEKLNKTLNDVWLDLQEYYYSETNKQSFNRFKNNFKNVILCQNEVTGCYAGLKLVELGIEEGYETLMFFKISAIEKEQIESAIRRKETKLELLKNKLDNNDKKEAVSFYKMVANVERNLNRQLNLTEINLERWIAYLAEIKEKHESEKKLARNNKNKRK